MAANWNGLNTYSVPVTLKGSVKASIVSLPFNMSGTQYYQAPDKQGLRLNNVPRLARGFQNNVASFGTPTTWSNQYNITLAGVSTLGGHPVYVLNGTPKNGGRVSNVVVMVDKTTYAVDDVNFSYTNKSSLHLTVAHQNDTTRYHFPSSMAIEARFPDYRGNATVTYGTYQVNQPLPANAFSTQQ
jgi:hypothetical protein